MFNVDAPYQVVRHFMDVSAQLLLHDLDGEVRSALAGQKCGHDVGERNSSVGHGGADLRAPTRAIFSART